MGGVHGNDGDVVACELYGVGWWDGGDVRDGASEGVVGWRHCLWGLGFMVLDMREEVSARVDCHILDFPCDDSHWGWEVVASADTRE